MIADSLYGVADWRWFALVALTAVIVATSIYCLKGKQ